LWAIQKGKREDCLSGLSGGVKQKDYLSVAEKCFCKRTGCRAPIRGQKHWCEPALHDGLHASGILRMHGEVSSKGVRIRNGVSVGAKSFGDFVQCERSWV